MEPVLVLVGVLALFPILLSASVLLNGWALHILWVWFIAPVFGLPVLTIAQSIGLATVVSFLTHQQIDAQPKDEDKNIKLVSGLLALIARPLFSVLIGWIVHFYL